MKKIFTIFGELGLVAIIQGAQAAEVSVYVGSGADTGISHCLLDTETGELKNMRLAVETPKPGALAISADRKTIYTVGKEKGEDAGFVASFAVQEDGSLKQVSKQSSVGNGPCYLSVDQTSMVLLAANYGSGSVVSYQAGGKDFSGGKVSEAVSFHQHEGKSVNEKRQTGPHAHSIYPSPDNKFVYAADLGTDKVEVYQLDAETAKLTPSGSAMVPAGSGPRHMAFSPDGSKLYVLNELTLTVSRFARNIETGALKMELTKPVLAEIGEKMSCSEIKFSKDGKFIYAACRDIAGEKRDTISVLKAEDLSIIQEQPAGIWIPRNFSLSPSGKWLLIAGQKSNQVIVHAVDTETGKLTATKHSAEVERPMWILFR